MIYNSTIRHEKKPSLDTLEDNETILFSEEDFRK